MNDDLIYLSILYAELKEQLLIQEEQEKNQMQYGEEEELIFEIEGKQVTKDQFIAFLTELENILDQAATELEEEGN